MLEVLQISENGLRANQAWINSISHNVANIQTAGFKKSIVNFGELVNTSSKPIGGAEKTQFEGMGVAVNSQIIDSRQGDMKATNRSLDLAIEGSGFFEVELDDGTLGYTRTGRLSVNEDGRLVTQDGHPLSSEILIPLDSENIKVKTNGMVQADVGADQTIEVGQIQLMNFVNPEQLKAIGNELYVSSSQSGEPEQLVDEKSHRILQGFIEMSNVDLIDEMTDLLLAQRSYQLNARLIQTADQILETINNLRR
jgi:flagellar basal-body rod protein FlgG